MQKIDIFTHVWPEPYFKALTSITGKMQAITARSGNVPMMTNLDRRFEVMDMFGPDYRQVLKDSGAPLIVGADDAKFLAIARASGNPLTVIPRAGHDVPLENPEALAEAIRRIALAGDPESSPGDHS